MVPMTERSELPEPSSAPFRLLEPTAEGAQVVGVELADAVVLGPLGRGATAEGVQGGPEFVAGLFRANAAEKLPWDCVVQPVENKLPL